MGRIDITTLKNEQEKDEQLEKSFSNNPVKEVIQKLFKDSFGGAKYRKFAIPDAKKLIETEIQSILKTKAGPYSSAAAIMLLKVKKATTMEEILTILNEYLFS